MAGRALCLNQEKKGIGITVIADLFYFQDITGCFTFFQVFSTTPEPGIAGPRFSAAIPGS